MRNSLAGKIKYIEEHLGNATKIMGVSIDDSNAGENRVLKLNLDKIEYQDDLVGEGVGYLETIWTDATRPITPTENVRGYNTQSKRIEYYIVSEGKWYYKWQGELNLESPTSAPSLISDNFEEGWFIDNSFTKTKEYNFDNSWRDENIFNKIMEDNFGTNWFIENVFGNILTENFEDSSWD